jgi:hypothetical protein
MRIDGINNQNPFAAIRPIDSPNVYTPVQAVGRINGFEKQAQKDNEDMNFISKNCNPNRPEHRKAGLGENFYGLG